MPAGLTDRNEAGIPNDMNTEYTDFVQVPWVVTMASELLERMSVWQDEASALAEETEAPAPAGSFNCKEKRGHRYWYLQTSTLGKVHQVYFGPDSDSEARRRVRISAFWEEARQAAQSRRDLCRIIRSAVLLPPAGSMGSKLLQALHQHGLHKTGAVVVGTYAFLAYQTLYGIRWSPREGATQDPDLASESDVTLITPEPMQLWAVLKELQFDPSRRTQEKVEPAVLYIWKRGEFRVDVLTPWRGDATRARPLALPNLGVHGEPWRFMEFLLENPILLALPVGAGVLVHVPEPARFALHKLMVASRPERAKAKAIKDVRQASAVLHLLLEEGAHDLQDAWVQICALHWQKHVKDGLRRVPAELQAQVCATLDIAL